MRRALVLCVVALALVGQPAEASVVRGIKRFGKACITLPLAIVGGMYLGYETWKLSLALERVYEGK